MPDWVKHNLDVWLTGAGITSGRVFRRVNRAGRAWGESMTEKVDGVMSKNSIHLNGRG
jgi:L-2-hydroxyglutarate oxidase LhgO